MCGYLFAENFKTLGQGEKVRTTWIIAIISSLVIFIGLAQIPDDIKIPNIVFPLIYTSIANMLFKKHQYDDITEHIKTGGGFYGWGRTVLISIVGAIITAVAMLVTFMIFLPDDFQE